MRTLLLALAATIVAPPAVWSQSTSDSRQTIDTQIAAAHRQAGITPAPRAEPHELLRRIYLDIIGRIPTPEEAAAFLNDPNPNRHHALIDALLIHPEMAIHWRGVFNHWLNGNLEDKRPGADEFLNYLEQRLAANIGWDAIAREMLDPNENDPASAPAAYFLASRLTGGDRAEQLDSVTVVVSSVYFGVQMQCAKCHDHPFVDDWKQANYYGLTAFFSRTFPGKAKAGNIPVLTERPDGELKFTSRKGGEQTAQLLFLNGSVSDAKSGRRKALIEVGITSPSPYFSRAMTNRLWKQIMGTGLVEPVDQIHDANPASHPELLSALAAEFAASKYDLRRFLSGLLHSEAYLRSSRWNGPGTRPLPNQYAVAGIKPLSPPQLAIALAQATGYTDVLKLKYEKDKARLKVDALTLPVVRKQFEREREYATLLTRFKQEGDPFQANTSHALYLTYNPIIRSMLSANGLVGKLTKLKDPEIAQAAYLTVLSRDPNEVERSAVTKHLAIPGVSREDLCRDIVWALLASNEFRFNH